MFIGCIWPNNFLLIFDKMYFLFLLFSRHSLFFNMSADQDNFVFFCYWFICNISVWLSVSAAVSVKKCVFKFTKLICKDKTISAWICVTAFWLHLDSILNPCCKECMMLHSFTCVSFRYHTSACVKQDVKKAGLKMPINFCLGILMYLWCQIRLLLCRT